MAGLNQRVKQAEEVKERYLEVREFVFLWFFINFFYSWKNRFTKTVVQLVS
jgi:hypothetical protein